MAHYHTNQRSGFGTPVNTGTYETLREAQQQLLFQAGSFAVDARRYQLLEVSIGDGLDVVTFDSVGTGTRLTLSAWACGCSQGI